MAWDVLAAMEALAQLTRTLESQVSVQIGAPKQYGSTVSGYVMVGPPEVVPRGIPNYTLSVDLIVSLGYLVERAEAAAEAKLAVAVADLSRRVLQNRRAAVSGNSLTVAPLLDGTVSSMDAPRSVAGPAEYALMAGLEYRVFFTTVRVSQDETI